MDKYRLIIDKKASQKKPTLKSHQPIKKKVVLKKIASVICGWHYPKFFYDMVLSQVIPDGWQHDMFVIGHRPPGLDMVKKEKEMSSEYGTTKFWKHDLIKDRNMYTMDRVLYQNFASEIYFKNNGFKYSLEPNIGGDFSVINQWLVKYNWKNYDILFMPHDDNYILTKFLFKGIIDETVEFWKRKENEIDPVRTDDKDWWCISNSTAPIVVNHIRWCFSFFNRKMLELIDGHFDMSRIKLSRIGLYDSPLEHGELSEWNMISELFRHFIIENNLMSKIKYLSPYYRSSIYNIECERGFLHYNLSWPYEYDLGIKNLTKVCYE